jgi:hypothetical protein
MQSHQSKSGTEQLGEAIAAAYESSTAVAPNSTTATELAARHLERVLARGANVRLVAALRDLAREFAPIRVRSSQSDGHGRTWAPTSLAAAR